jgi:hypothetical protein
MTRARVTPKRRPDQPSSAVSWSSSVGDDLPPEIGADTDPVPFRVREHGEAGRLVIGDYLTAGCHGGSDPLLGCLRGNPDVKVEPLMWCRVPVGRLKPHIRKPAVGIDNLAVVEVVGMSVEQRRPERSLKRNLCAVETDLHLKNCGWFGPQAAAPGGIADPAGDDDVCFCDEPPSIVGGDSKFDPRRAKTDLEDVIGAVMAFGEKGSRGGEIVSSPSPVQCLRQLAPIIEARRIDVLGAQSFHSEEANP